jgi:hypothetical protein
MQTWWQQSANSNLQISPHFCKLLYIYIFHIKNLKSFRFKLYRRANGILHICKIMHPTPADYTWLLAAHTIFFKYITFLKGRISGVHELINSLECCLSCNVFVSPSFLKDNFAWCSVFLFIHLFTCAYIVWTISPTNPLLPPSPSPTPLLIEVEPVLSLSLILLNRKHKQ